MGLILKKELMKLCRLTSRFADKDIGKFEVFSWSEITADLKENALSLFTILDACISTKTRYNKDIAMGFAASIMAGVIVNELIICKE